MVTPRLRIIRPESATRFALIGTAGFVAPRHLQAIHALDGALIAAVDPHDSVGVLDRFFPDAYAFTEIERFDRFLEKQRRPPVSQGVQYVSICSPNYLHDAHVRLALRVKAHAICEKPLVINPWNLDQLQELQDEHERQVFCVLQLRLHPQVQALKRALESESPTTRHNVELTYVTRRGRWYHTSWKGDTEKSGGIAMNIGIHFFDLLVWLFGSVERNEVEVAKTSRMSGTMELQRASVRWRLSVDHEDLPRDVRQQGGHAYRSFRLDGDEIDLSSGFGDLHTEVYRDVLSGGGFGIEDAKPAIDLVYMVRTQRRNQNNRVQFAVPQARAA